MIAAVSVLVVTQNMKQTVIKIVMATVLVMLQMIAVAYVQVVTPVMKLIVI